VRIALAASCAGAGLLAPAGSAQAATPYTAYVGNYASGTVTPINTATNKTSPTISVGSPSAIAITPDGTKAYVCNYDKGKPAGTVTPITLASGAAGSPITVGAEPNAIAITPDGTKAFVSNYNENKASSVTVITLSSGATSTISVGNGPYGVAITPDGSKAYVANHYDGTVTPITIATNTPGTAIKVGAGEDLARPDWVAVTPDGSKAYVANYGTPEKGAPSEIVPITVATDKAGPGITGVTKPNAIAIRPDGATAYIAEDGTPGHVRPMTLSNNSLGSPITVGNNPYDVAITPDQASAYVADYNEQGASFVTPINLQTSTAGANIPAENGPDAVAITPDQAPVASLNVTAATAGSATSFDASASTVAYGSIANYQWSFGDSSTAATPGPTTTHVYPSAGTYAVTLTETDAAGTSTIKVFNSHTMSRNGGPSAQTTHSVTVTSALLAPLAPPGAPSAPGSPSTPLPTSVGISTSSVTMTSRGDAVIDVSCPASAHEGCRGTITIRLAQPRARHAQAIAARCGRGCRPLGSAKYEARAGQKIHVRVHIASYGRRLLARRHALRVTVTATSVAGGRTATSSRTITLRAHTRAA
jgi:YVTN family beta-propeller protein